MNRKDLAGDAKSNGSLGCSDHEIIELKNMRKTAIKIMSMDYKSELWFVQETDSHGRLPWGLKGPRI